MHSHRLLNRFPHFAGWSAFAAAEAVVALVLGGKAFPFCFLAFFYSGSPLFLARASFFYGLAEFPTFLSRVRSFLILRSRAPVLGEVSGRESEFLAARASVIEGDVCESSLVASFALPCSVCVLSLGGFMLSVCPASLSRRRTRVTGRAVACPICLLMRWDYMCAHFCPSVCVSASFVEPRVFRAR